MDIEIKLLKLWKNETMAANFFYNEIKDGLRYYVWQNSVLRVDYLFNYQLDPVLTWDIQIWGLIEILKCTKFVVVSWLAVDSS